jgi:glutamate dehydrogenase
MTDVLSNFGRADEGLEKSKADLVKTASAGRPDAESVEPFLSRYFLHVAAEDILSWPAVELYEVACGHREFAQLRPPGAPKVRVVTFSPDELAGRAGHTLVEIVTDDMPFLVDSVRQELSRRDIAINLVIHPQFVVRRDLDGQLLEVLGTLDAHEAPRDALVESWMHFEVERQGGPDDEAALRDDVMRVLRDVHDAVEDWPRMKSIAQRTADQLAASPPARVDAAECAEAAEFMRWLADDHFTFIGYREYRLVDDPATGEPALGVVPGTGLGILRADKPTPRLLSTMRAEVREKVYDPQLLLITKANSRSTVHRPTYLDYIGLKIFNADDEVVGEQRFLGLFTSSAYMTSVLSIPLLRRKVATVIERSGYPPHSHSGKDLLDILENHPRDEMFQTSTPELYETAIGVLHLQERRRLRLFMRRDVYGRFVSCLVYLPRDRYSTDVRLRMQQILLDALGGTSLDYTLWLAESVLARVHFVVRVGADEATGAGAGAVVDREDLERRLVAATRTWDDDLTEVLDARLGTNGDRAIERRYTGAFPEAYKEDFDAHVAVDDIEELERLNDSGDLGLDLYEPAGAAPGEARLKMYRLGPPVSLSHVLPLLQSMGVEVTDERPYRIERNDAEHAWIYDFGLRNVQMGFDDGPRSRHQRFQDALAAVWRGAAEADGFQALVVRSGLAWRQVMVLRAYAKYLRQGGSRFSQDYVESALVSNATIARLLVELFEVRLDPAGGANREATAARLAERIESALDDVSSLDEDRIVRSYLGLISATLRTNYWQSVDGEPKPYLSLKFDSAVVPDLPAPRPKFEIFVYSPRVEGIHLRFGMVARGGIRYSDRREDFRTEILGLAKTQTVKNSVIVPVGSKGGFVVKRLPPDSAGREAQQAEVVYCYSTLIRGMLDLTDNLAVDRSGRTVVPPSDTVRYDGDDTYLVVAADKGTATFSDLANGISADYGYWLGDAFASGGSAGYDHKEMGITARGAWESVKRHFRDLGVNCQTTDFSCVGIGDMSGDVFGNGMLLSRHIRLVAAFDHRHIFVDPNPDAAASFAERERLFKLPRSSWADYDTSLISAGGGVWPRTAKSIPVSPEMAAALGIEQASLAPVDLMRAVLRAPVDLLWNGGIGTYVKAHAESNSEVGDRANDAIRIDGRDLACRVVGEGGNLGFTQLGRLEFALAGGHINTDAIDNSAGVDTSDHEVNIKILLDVAARSGHLAHEEREPLLARMTDEIADLVLRDNYSQNLALACAQAEAVPMLHVDAAYIDTLEKSGELVRSLERLPDAEALAERRAAGLGLTRPELAVLLAYAKIAATHAIASSDLADDIFAQAALVEYFPTALRERFAAAMAEHPLLREIIATQLANQLVNFSGATFVARIAGETMASTAEIVRAHTATRQVFGLDELWAEIEQLDDVVANDVQTRLLLVVRQTFDRATRWFLTNRRPPIDVPETVAQLQPGVESVLAALPGALRGTEAAIFTGRVDDFVQNGVSAELARKVVALGWVLDALSVVEIARRTAGEHAVAAVRAVAAVHFGLADELGISRLGTLIAGLPRDSRWHTLARMAARDDLQAAQAELTTDVLQTTASTLSADERISQWQQTNSVAINRAGAIIDDIVSNDSADLATLSVALREVRALVRAASLPSR